MTKRVSAEDPTQFSNDIFVNQHIAAATTSATRPLGRGKAGGEARDIGDRADRHLYAGSNPVDSEAGDHTHGLSPSHADGSPE